MIDVPRSNIFDDIYFSVEDGPAETQHVFIDSNDLPARFSGKENFTICETGFGTGLNFLMAWKALNASAVKTKLRFISFEKYPLSRDDIQKALQPYFSEEQLFAYTDQYPLKCQGVHQLDIAENIELVLIFGDVNDEITKLEETVDAWFLDGFAPAKNPEMWTNTLFENMARLSVKGTTFATFTAAGIVRRGLAQNGFEVQKIKGFGRKRDMIKGEYLG